MFAERSLQGCVVSAVNFVFLFTIEEEKESGLAGELTSGKSTLDFVRNVLNNGRIEFHAEVVLVELHVESSVVLNH